MSPMGGLCHPTDVPRVISCHNGMRCSVSLSSHFDRRWRSELLLRLRLPLLLFFLPLPRAKLYCQVAEESLEAAAEARDRARQKIRATVGALEDLPVAPELRDHLINVVLDEDKVPPADVLLAIRAPL